MSGSDNATDEHVRGGDVSWRAELFVCGYRAGELTEERFGRAIGCEARHRQLTSDGAYEYEFHRSTGGA